MKEGRENRCWRVIIVSDALVPTRRHAISNHDADSVVPRGIAFHSIINLDLRSFLLMQLMQFRSHRTFYNLKSGWYSQNANTSLNILHAKRLASSPFDAPRRNDNEPIRADFPCPIEMPVGPISTNRRIYPLTNHVWPVWPNRMSRLTWRHGQYKRYA